MDQVLGEFDIGPQKSLFVANLSLQSLVDCGLEHMGDDGYFLFEACDDPAAKGITILSKCCSFEAALELVDLLRASHSKRRQAPLPAAL